MSQFIYMDGPPGSGKTGLLTKLKRREDFDFEPVFNHSTESHYSNIDESTIGITRLRKDELEIVYSEANEKLLVEGSPASAIAHAVAKGATQETLEAAVECAMSCSPPILYLYVRPSDRKKAFKKAKRSGFEGTEETWIAIADEYERMMEVGMVRTIVVEANDKVGTIIKRINDAVGSAKEIKNGTKD